MNNNEIIDAIKKAVRLYPELKKSELVEHIATEFKEKHYLNSYETEQLEEELKDRLFKNKKYYNERNI